MSFFLTSLSFLVFGKLTATHILAQYKQYTPVCILVTIHESTLTHHYCPKFIVYTRVYSGCCLFYKFGQMYRTCIYHCSITQNTFTALKFFCALPILPSPLNSGKHWIFYCLFAFSRMSCNWNYAVYVNFQTGYFHWVISTELSMSFYSIIAYYFLVLNYTSLSISTTVCLSLSLLKDVADVFNCWQLSYKAAINILMPAFVWV